MQLILLAISPRAAVAQGGWTGQTLVIPQRLQRAPSNDSLSISIWDTSSIQLELNPRSEIIEVEPEAASQRVGDGITLVSHC